MYVVVGSGNPVKRRATEAALAGIGEGRRNGGEDDGVVVTAHAVDSGVAEQPRGHAETRRGAVNRARAARRAAEEGRVDAAHRADAAGAADSPTIGVGLEGGVARFAGIDGGGAVGDGTIDDGAVAGDGAYLVMWAAVTDGERVGTGAGPSFPLPTGIATRIRAGEELGPVMDDVLDAEGVARGQGAAGAFTDGLLDREAALAAAVAAAFGPFRSSLY